MIISVLGLLWLVQSLPLAEQDITKQFLQETKLDDKLSDQCGVCTVKISTVTAEQLDKSKWRLRISGKATLKLVGSSARFNTNGQLDSKTCTARLLSVSSESSLLRSVLSREVGKETTYPDCTKILP